MSHLNRESIVPVTIVSRLIVQVTKLYVRQSSQSLRSFIEWV